MVVLATSTLNRILVVELALAAVIPGLLVALHYAVQILRPRMGFGSDQAGRCTPFILGGMAVLASGGMLGAWAVVQIPEGLAWGLLLLTLAFFLIGLGVSACGTAVLVLLAKRVTADRRAGAATMVWLLMIAGFAVTAGTAGHYLDPYSEERLLLVAAVITGVAVLATTLLLWKLEGNATLSAPHEENQTPFLVALRQVWKEPDARHFTIFVFVSMLAFSAQDLILEPFAGLVFGYTPGESTKLSGLQHSGILVGMLLVAFAGSGKIFGRRFGSLKFWTISGCLASGIALAGLVAAGMVGPGWPLDANVMLLGAANGAFSIAAIASMMRLAGEGRARREGTRMGLWGASQALAFGAGGILGTSLSDIARLVMETPASAYALVFGLEALLFVVAARLASQIKESASHEGSSSAVTPRMSAAHAVESTRSVGAPIPSQGVQS